MTESYDSHAVEAKWQEEWRRSEADATPESPDDPFYMLEMFAYPSGDIHMGHFRNYTIGDVVARYQRMKGRDVLHPFGWDAFGLPAENAAIEHDVHPAEWTYRNIETSRRTLRRMGLSYDWDREIVTCREDFYRFTQWMFLLLYRRGLAYRESSEVNWCPVDQTVLANEHVVDGACWRHPDTPVERRELEQWFFRITEYAERLLEGLDDLEAWPESTVKQQRTWIGRSEGTEVDFELQEGDETLSVFTTRPDTLWGVTFMTLAPEHPLVEKATIPERRSEVRAYVEAARSKSEIERTDASRDKDGVFTGSHVIHPLTGDPVPLWVADYVLATYGTGAVMGVPAHDQRDLDFARRYGLPVRVVIQPEGEQLEGETLEEAYTGDGVMVDSGPFDGIPVENGIRRVTEFLQEQGIGREQTQYRLRDWLISRQRYWGCPIPMIHCVECGIVPVPEEDLPVLLPETVRNFVPTGRSPLEDVPEFFETTCPECGADAHRDPDTMDTFVDSSWYHLRYVDPDNEEEPFSREAARSWLPVDFYIGGDEHATGHLLYFRFFTKVLHDAGWLEIDEPATRLFHHGMVKDAEGEIMSKSKGNVVSPARLFDQDGVDIPRLSMLFFAPSADEILWDEKGLEGVRRFVHRLWDLFVATTADRRMEEDREVDLDALSSGAREAWRLAHRAVQRATDSLEGDLNFNTAVAAFMEMLNALRKMGRPGEWSDEDFPVLVGSFEISARALAPLAPHLGEELWHRLGHEGSVFDASWPRADEVAMAQESVEIPVQVDGKLRSRIYLAPDSGREEMERAALSDERIREILGEEEPERVIVVPGRLVNLVTG